MILASARCPSCHTLSEYPVEEAETFLTCFGCQQRNPIGAKRAITGRCENCGRPIDGGGHVLGDNGLTGCRNARQPA